MPRITVDTNDLTHRVVTAKYEYGVDVDDVKLKKLDRLSKHVEKYYDLLYELEKEQESNFKRWEDENGVKIQPGTGSVSTASFQEKRVEIE